MLGGVPRLRDIVRASAVPIWREGEESCVCKIFFEEMGRGRDGISARRGETALGRMVEMGRRVCAAGSQWREGSKWSRGVVLGEGLGWCQ